jgi:metal-dependent amidase/aminoacylase/carboxypeptidase family protein
MEMHVKVKSLGALMEVNKKVDRALRAGAMAIGAEVEITDIPPQLPTLPDKRMDDIYRKNISQLIGEENVLEGKPGSAGCDTGDVTQLMPVLRICFGGF